MLVRELIAELNKFNPDLPVKIHPESDLFIEDTVTANGDVGTIEESVLYFDKYRERYFEKDEFEENLEEDFEDTYETENLNDQHLEIYKKERIEKADKMHAVYIQAVV